MNGTTTTGSRTTVLSSALSLILLAAPSTATGRPTAGRTIELDVVVEADGETLYRMWTTTDGVRTLFPGADALIGDAVDGEFRVAFDPGHPDGTVSGTAGCKILELVPGRRVAFEWRGPVWATEMNATPLATWVEVDLEPVAERDSVTSVSLRHHGYGTGEGWDRAFEFFAAAWSRTLDGLQQRFAAQPELEASGDGESGPLFAFLVRPGPKWDVTKPLYDQPRLFNHAAYLGALRERGILAVGGPFADISGESTGALALGVFRVPDLVTAERYMQADPAVQAGTFVYEIRPWKANLPAE